MNCEYCVTIDTVKMVDLSGAEVRWRVASVSGAEWCRLPTYLEVFALAKLRLLLADWAYGR